MNKYRFGIAVCVIFLSAVFLTSFFFHDTSTQKLSESLHLKPSQVLAWNCEIPEYRPETLMIFCGDGGAYVDKITWTEWGQDGAAGTGEYFENLCNPDCADGEFVQIPVYIALKDLTPRMGKFYLRTLDISSSNGKDFPRIRAKKFEWDQMDFIQTYESQEG